VVVAELTACPGPTPPQKIFSVPEDQHINQPHQQTSDIQDLKKYDEKAFSSKLELF
jgi:hypothetical protein